jgi:opacity protein-like surface antigen
MRKSMRCLTLAVALAVVASASADPLHEKPRTPVYAMEVYSIGSGGYAGSGDFDLEATIGQSDVNVMKLADPTGYELDGGVWPIIARADCSGSVGLHTADLSACD